jgi:hypothetical protein
MSPAMASAPAASAVASVESERATAVTAQSSARRRSMTARPRLRAPKINALRCCCVSFMEAA